MTPEGATEVSRLRAPDPRRDVVFASPLFLAPMEGVTDRTFRAAVLDLGGCGAACTEFVRISVAPVPARVIRKSLGAPRGDVPVAVQIMAPGTEHLAETVAHAESAGASWIDLNFGCPVARVCGKGAGSALLDDPPLLEAIVRAARGATRLAVSAKIRVGVTDSARLHEIVDAAAAGGAAMLTVHGRLRADSYEDPARWDRIAAAVARWRGRSDGPVCGNGGVRTAEDAHRMLRETGCDAVMVGRGALADPFVFRRFAGGPAATPAEAAAFLIRYADAIQPDTAAHHRLGRIKQLVRRYEAGGLFAGREAERWELLRASDAGAIRRWFERFTT